MQQERRRRLEVSEGKDEDSDLLAIIDAHKLCSRLPEAEEHGKREEGKGEQSRAEQRGVKEREGKQRRAEHPKEKGRGGKRREEEGGEERRREERERRRRSGLPFFHHFLSEISCSCSQRIIAAWKSTSDLAM